MKPRLRFNVRALADIEDIGNRIASGGGPLRAFTYTRDLRARCGQLIDVPEVGRLRPEYGPSVRAVPFGRFLILYRWQSGRGVVGAAQRAKPAS